jgi:hypothetical protein
MPHRWHANFRRLLPEAYDAGTYGRQRRLYSSDCRSSGDTEEAELDLYLCRDHDAKKLNREERTELLQSAASYLNDQAWRRNVCTITIKDAYQQYV